MSAHTGGSGPRSNSYSQNKFTNWSEYEPWWSEVQSVFKGFDGKIAKNPAFPKIIELEPHPDFARPCRALQVETKLKRLPAEFLQGLRAVFILSGTNKQSKSWGRCTTFYGHYWNCCVFLHAFPYHRVSTLDALHRFYINDVLVHEVGHHVDETNETIKDRERFAERFVETYGSV